MSGAAAIRGWCPGVLRPMATGDGLLLKVRIDGATLRAEEARAIAACARECGNGALDLTRRANLNLRGVSADSLLEAQRRLAHAGLLDADASAESLRNVVVTPMSGLDPTAILDARPIARAIVARLVDDPSLRDLPPKFCFAVDDGGAFLLRDCAVDIAFIATRGAGEAFLTAALGVADGGAEPVGACAIAQAPEVAARLAAAFIALTQSVGAPRIAGRWSREQARRLARAAGVAECAPAQAARRPAPAPQIGFHAIGALSYFAAAAPYGRLSAQTLVDLADCADEFGIGETRLTTSRIALIPGVEKDAAGRLAERLSALASDPADARLAVVACPGAPDCRAATTATRADAAALAAIARRLAPNGVGVHVSGCAKSCARSAPCPAKLVAREGSYDVFFDGAAAPAARGLAIGAAQQLLSRMVEERRP